jgi:hypothetical protein
MVPGNGETDGAETVDTPDAAPRQASGESEKWGRCDK